MTTKKLESYFIKAFFCLVIIGTAWQPFSNFEIKRPKKCFMYFLPFIEKIPKWTPKNRRYESLSTIHIFYFDLGPKRHLGLRDPIIGSMV